MASSSSRQENVSSGSGLQINTGSSYVIKPKTMAIPFESFEVQVESPVDFASLKRNGMNLDALTGTQQLYAYFSMLNGPTYVKLVKDFWVRAEVYDLDAAKVEKHHVVARDPSLKGTTRKEMGLEPFRQTEIRSAVMGIPITIKESGGIILDKDTPDIPDEAPLRVRGKRAKTDYDSEAATAQAKKQKKAKSEATNYDSVPAPAPKRKRGKGESSIIKEAAKLAHEEDWDTEAEEPRAKKMQLNGDEIVSPMFIMTPEMTKRVDEHAKKLLEEQKKKEQYLATREEKFKSIGLDSCDEYYVQKLAEVNEIADKVEQEAVKEAKEMLEQIQGTSEAGVSEAVPESAAPESATETGKSEASGNPFDLNSAKETQILDSPTIISPPLSFTNDSDHDEMPLGQRINLLPKPSQKPKPFEPKYPAVLQSIGEMSQRRVDLCNKLPADHPLQPPVITPLNMIPVNNPKPSQTTQQTPLQEGQSSAAVEGSEDPEEPNTIDLPHYDSPSNLFSL